MRIEAPWTWDQAMALNRWQNAGFVHEFTCGTEGCRYKLIAVTAGLVCPKCDYTQNWAHDFMLQGPRNPLERQAT
jgi:hypothetical protein